MTINDNSNQNDVYTHVEQLYNMLGNMLQYDSTLKTVQDGAQNALSEKGEQTMAMANGRVRIWSDVDDYGGMIAKQIAVTGNNECERYESIFKKIAETPRGMKLLQDMGFCLQPESTGMKPKRKDIPLFKDYAFKWLNEYKTNAKENTRSQYKKWIKYYLNPFFGEKRLDEIMLDDILTYLSGMEMADQAESSVNSMLTILRQTLQCATTDGYITNSPASDPRVKNPCEKKAIREPLSEADWLDVIDQISSLNGNAMLYMALVIYTGMRKGEVLGLRWEDVDIAARRITVRRNVTHPDGYRPCVGTTKNKVVGTVPILGGLAEYLKDHPSTGYIIHKKDNPEEPLNSNEFWAMWDYIRKRIDLHNATCHTFRHTLATLLNEKGVDGKTIQEILRHKSFAMTARYIHVSDADKQKAMQLLTLALPIAS